MRLLVHLLLVASILSATNLHLPLLQVAAWTGMVIRYSKDASIEEAIRKTFDGEHPCRMCCAIRKAQAKPKHELNAATDEGKLNLVSLPDPGYLAPRLNVAATDCPQLDAATFSSPPPVPPPRIAS